jgi:hypothetical protein
MCKIPYSSRNELLRKNSSASKGGGGGRVKKVLGELGDV